MLLVEDLCETWLLLIYLELLKCRCFKMKLVPSSQWITGVQIFVLLILLSKCSSHLPISGFNGSPYGLWMLLYNDYCFYFEFLQGRSASRVPIRFASAGAVVTKPSSSGGLFGWLTGNNSNTSTPLEFPLAGVTLPPPLHDYVEPGKTKITTLPNGIKIASETYAVCHSIPCPPFSITRALRVSPEMSSELIASSAII